MSGHRLVTCPSLVIPNFMEALVEMAPISSAASLGCRPDAGRASHGKSIHPVRIDRDIKHLRSAHASVRSLSPSGVQVLGKPAERRFLQVQGLTPNSVRG